MTSAASLRNTAWADWLGIWASAACLVHCLLTPVLLSFSTVFVHWLPGEERTHRTLACLVAALGAVALLRGFRRHRRRRVLSLMATGLALIVTAAWAGNALLNHRQEVALTILGSILLIAAHRLNHTFCKSCECAAG